MDRVCRTCLRKAEILLPLFDDTQLPKKIQIISNVKMTKEDSLPQSVCAECVININLSYNFRRVLINSDLQLKNRPLRPDKRIATVKEEVFLQAESTSLVVSRIKIEPSVQLHVREESPVNENLIKDVPKLEVYKWSCKKCDFKTHKELELFQHRKTHVLQKRVCNICGNLVSAANFSKHLINHTTNPVACPECGKICKNNESLRYHKMRHKGGMTCEYCGKYYSYSVTYRRHIRIHHLGKVPHKKHGCSLCEKAFKTSKDLKRHMRSHTGERPYPCEYCKKGFSSSNALKTHIRQHTNEHPYICEFCGTAFKQNVSLRNHLKMAHQVNKSIDT